MRLSEIKDALIGKRLKARYNPRLCSKWCDLGIITNVVLGQSPFLLTDRPGCIFNPWKESIGRQDAIWLAVEGETVKCSINNITHEGEAVIYKIGKRRKEETAMTIEEIKKTLIGKRMSADGEWCSEGTIEDVKIVEFEGVECLFLYEKENPNELWCWFPLKNVEAFIEGKSVSGGQPDYASIYLINW